MRDRLSTGGYRTLTVASVGALCLLVAIGGAVAVWAQMHNTWEHFFLMEQTFALLTPIVVGVGVIALLAGMGTVLRIE